MIVIQWIFVILITLPALLTKDIYFRPTFLCWVPKERLFHVTIYACGAIPTIIYIITKIEIFCSIVIIFLPLFVTVEKLTVILLDRQIQKILKIFFCQTTTQIIPIAANQQYFIRRI
ncbi:unnamed protein product [Adineta steineri]|uniref:Uncharacterized protein n=1 Tax=Adineta steineri TaxID=433720 RepID=A0A816DIN0_9BILA|nr:unnamed protein product [Adineta steineri]CAF1633500.1 unnamed protein product [Adineta steineri]